MESQDNRGDLVPQSERKGYELLQNGNSPND